MKRLSPLYASVVGSVLCAIWVSGCGGYADGIIPVYVPDETGRDVAGWSSDAPGVSPSAEAGVLKRGDKVLISLRDIMRPEDVNEVIDTRGMVTLPYIGNIKIEGLTTAEAEDLIEKEYVRKGIYKRLTAIVLGQDDEYYITGEVKGEGRYQMNGEMTLSQVIIAAQGLTDFAKESAIEIRRGKIVTTYDLGKIRKGTAEDPVIEPKDIISVPRRMI